MPVLKAKKGAANVCGQNGTYRIELTGEGRIRSGNEVVDLKGDKDARVIETDAIFIIRPDRVHTFCIPKRILSKEYVVELREALCTVTIPFYVYKQKTLLKSPKFII